MEDELKQAKNLKGDSASKKSGQAPTPKRQTVKLKVRTDSKSTNKRGTSQKRNKDDKKGPDEQQKPTSETVKAQKQPLHDVNDDVEGLSKSDNYSNQSFDSDNEKEGMIKSLNGGQVSTAKKLSQRDVKDEVAAKVDGESAGYTSVEEDKEVMKDEIDDK